jgi:hypothetical protein
MTPPERGKKLALGWSIANLVQLELPVKISYPDLIGLISLNLILHYIIKIASYTWWLHQFDNLIFFSFLLLIPRDMSFCPFILHTHTHDFSMFKNTTLTFLINNTTLIKILLPKFSIIYKNKINCIIYLIIYHNFFVLIIEVRSILHAIQHTFTM